MSDYFGNMAVKAQYSGTPAMVETGNKTPEIEILWRELEKESGLMLENLKALEVRLQPVLVPDAPQPIGNDGSTAQAAPPHSSLYSVLNDLRRRVTGANILINQIRQRLEI